MSKIAGRRGEMAVGVGLFAVAALSGASAWTMPTGGLSLPGPGFFPLALSLLLGVVAIGVIVRAWHHGDHGVVRVDLPIAGVAVLALAVLVLVWQPLGFLLATFFFLTLLFRSIAGLGWARTLVVAAVVTAGTWGLFVGLLGVRLPVWPLST
jgi:hypothetical protein